MSKNEVEKHLALEQLDELVPQLVQEADYSELYGYDLTELSQSDSGKAIRETLLLKFLEANGYEVTPAKAQLLKALKWRKEFNPLSAAFAEKHNAELEKLGLVTVAPETGVVTTWNLYGAVKDREKLFGDLDDFLRWRVGLMEQGISLLDLSKPEKSYITQVHDYFDVSFFRMDANTRVAAKATISLFQENYPEFLSTKYFVNVPSVMGWMYALIKTFLSKETIDKFHVLSNGRNLAAVMGTWLPHRYGGTAASLDEIKVKEFALKNPELLKVHATKVVSAA